MAALLAAVVVLTRSHWIGISDDDASRTLIAWDFARHPSLDPTRSSWLPLHTALLGTVLAITRELVWTPRCVSLAAGAACVTMAAVVAQAIGTRARGWMALGPLLGVAFAWSVYASWASGVPEMASCAFLLAGAWALAGTVSPGRAWIAGIALGLACGQRYEAWPATAGLVLASLATGAVRRPSARAVLIASVCVVPVAWLCINHARSGDALDFVHRVARYRAAHEAMPAVATRVVRYPFALLRCAGLVVLLAGVGVRRAGRIALPSVVGAVSVVLWLAISDAIGAGPTHHVERALLAPFWLLVPVAARGGEAIAQRSRGLAMALATTAMMQLIATDVSPPRDIDPDAVAIGRLTGAWVQGDCFVLEGGRLDALDVQLASTVPQRAVADRRWGEAAPTAATLDALATRCPIAVVHTEATAARMNAHGFVERARRGRWRLLVRDQRGGTVGGPGGTDATSRSSSSQSPT